MPARPSRRIASEDNPLFRSLRKLVSGRGAKKSASVLVSGPRTIRDLVASRAALCEAWISTDDQPGPPAELPAGASWYQLSRKLFGALDSFGTGAPLLLVRAPGITPWNESAVSGCSLLVPFQDPENVGAVIRSAVAFGVAEVVILKEGGYPFHPRAVRASGGAVFQAALRSGPSIAALPAHVTVIPLSAGGADAGAFRFPERFALLPGLEGPGIPAALRPRAISIPISQQVESLNAATAAAIALFLWARQRSRSLRESQ
jgi:16S rRNA (guanine527-N7)-methyltransferase